MCVCRNLRKAIRQLREYLFSDFSATFGIEEVRNTPKKFQGLGGFLPCKSYRTFRHLRAIYCAPTFLLQRESQLVLKAIYLATRNETESPHLTLGVRI